MAKRKQTKAAMPYLRRIAEDEYVQKQLRQAASGLREVYSRGRHGGSAAAEDKKLYGKVREAATSIRRAVGAIEEPPPKPKRRSRKMLVFAFALIATLLAKRATSGGQREADHEDAGATKAQQQESAEPIAAPSGGA